jgi:hypothetical protein
MEPQASTPTGPLARVVLAKGNYVARRVLQQRALVVLEIPDLTGTIVRISENARGQRALPAAVNVPARDRASAGGMRVLEHRHDVVVRIVAQSRVVPGTARALKYSPTVIAATVRNKIDLFDSVLADVSYPQQVSSSIERPSPWVSHSDGPYLLASVSVRRTAAVTADRSGSHKRVGRRDQIRYRRADRNVNVDPQHFSEKLCRILGTSARIIARPAVAHSYVKLSIGSEI